MRMIPSALVICLALGGLSTARAQDNFEDIISGVAQGLLNQELDRQAITEARRVGTIASWRDYLARFPNGMYRAEAQNEIAKLDKRAQPSVPAPAPTAADKARTTESDLVLSREQRRQIQTQLTSLGYDAGVADGLWGRKTRDAIKRWQGANGATASGYLSERQIRQIAEQAGRSAPPEQKKAANDLVEENLIGLTLDERREIQRRLTALGYNTGGADGILGQNSRRALAAWQRDEGLRASGYITADQLRRLRRQTGA